jgi:hypothetical protein
MSTTSTPLMPLPPVHASELPGALALSLEHIFYSPQMTDASTMPITCNARKRCLDFCHHYENIRLPHAKFGCILSLHPIPSRCIFITPCTIMDSYSSPIILGRILTPVWHLAIRYGFVKYFTTQVTYLFYGFYIVLVSFGNYGG